MVLSFIFLIFSATILSCAYWSFVLLVPVVANSFFWLLLQSVNFLSLQQGPSSTFTNPDLPVGPRGCYTIMLTCDDGFLSLEINAISFLPL